MKMFDRHAETLGRDDLEQLQLERLQALIARLRRNVRRWREMLGDFHPRSLADLSGIPFTRPEDLLAAYPYGMFALPLREVIRLHSTVGPNGRQLVIGHTRNDLAQWGRLVARQLAAANVSDHDVIQICLENGLLSSALGYTLGAEQIEASVIPEDPFHIEYQLAMLENYRVTVLITTPTNAAELAQCLDRKKRDAQSLSLLTVLLSRPVAPDEREALHHGLFAQIRCSFGVPEILDPGLCVECPEGRFHVNEDHFLVEEHEGELVVTTLCREAMPLLRYRTRIRAALRRERCPCGRVGVTLEPGARLDGRLRVCERPLYPSQVEEVLAQTRARGLPFRVQISERGAVIELPVTDAVFTDTMRELVALREEIQAEILTRLGVPAEVRYLPPREFERGGGAPGRASDPG